jgi:hypothetical protein
MNIVRASLFAVLALALEVGRGAPPSSPPPSSPLPSSPLSINVDVAQILAECGEGFAYLINLRSTQLTQAEKEKVINARPNLQKSLAQLAADNQDLANILEDIQQHGFASHSQNQHAQNIVDDMHVAFRQLTSELDHISQQAAGGPRKMEALFTLKHAKQNMLQDLDEIFRRSSASAPLTKDQIAVLDTYIPGLRKIADQASKANDALTNFPDTAHPKPSAT